MCFAVFQAHPQINRFADEPENGANCMYLTPYRHGMPIAKCMKLTLIFA